jgi:hypothetical protein
MAAADVLFEFDCQGSYYIDIMQYTSHLRNNRVVNDEWFKQAHPMHEPGNNISHGEKESAVIMKKTSSVLKNTTNVLRVAQVSKKKEPDVSSVTAPTKTTAKIQVFRNVTGQKRHISTDQENDGEQLSSSAKRPNTQVPANSGIAEAVSIDMSTKLEEYRLQKKKFSQDNKKIDTKQNQAHVSQRMNAAVKPKGKLTCNNLKQSQDDQEMLELLMKHNKKFVEPTLYEPSRHSVRDVRRWEKESGKIWSTLNPSDREIANKQISAYKTIQ